MRARPRAPLRPLTSAIQKLGKDPLLRELGEASSHSGIMEVLCRRYQVGAAPPPFVHYWRQQRCVTAGRGNLTQLDLDGLADDLVQLTSRGCSTAIAFIALLSDVGYLTLEARAELRKLYKQARTSIPAPRSSGSYPAWGAARLACWLRWEEFVEELASYEAHDLSELVAMARIALDELAQEWGSELKTK